MTHDKAYLEAEKKIEEVMKSGATELFLCGGWDSKLVKIPESLGKLKLLEKLDISDNNIRILPSDLGELKNLRELDISNNKLSALPNSLADLTQLRLLDLRHNRLVELPDWIGEFVNLQILDASFVRLEVVPDWIGKLHQLKTLHLRGNKLKTLPESIGELTQLSSLYLNDNQLTDLPLSLSKLKKLETFQIDGNPLDPIKVKNIFERKLKVFLCHASQDKPTIHKLYEKLSAEDWIDPWLDAKKLLPGQDWQAEIKNAVETADNVIIFLSNTSINKDGFIQKELRLAKDIALEKTEGSIFLIPLRLDDSEVPRSLQMYQWANYFGEDKEQTYNNLLASLKLRLEDIKRKEAFKK